MPYSPNPSRYEHASFRRSGHSGLKLPLISLGTWQNFGDTSPFEAARQLVRRAFDRGVTHFDLANMYGPPAGSAEDNFGAVLRADFPGLLRHELIISSKAGYEMWPGPYGQGAARKHLVASLDQTLLRLGTDYVDIFYVHRPWPDDPWEETASALAHLVAQGKALYVGVSSFSPKRTREASAFLKDVGLPLTIHQPSYSMLNRHIEDELLDTLEELGVGCIGFSALAQGLLTDRYATGSTPSGRALEQGGSFNGTFLSEKNLANVRGLAKISRDRGQTLAQMAIAWVLRDQRVTSALVGARTVEQLDDTLDALNNLDFTPEELAQIDTFAKDAGIDLWRGISTL